MELGKRLKAARLEAGLSQRQLCGEVITRNMLSQIENGAARPSMDTLLYLADRLGKPMELAQFEAMPEDLQQAYLRRLRQRGGSEATVGRMLGISPRRLQQLLRQHRVRLDRPDPEAWASFLDG